MLTCFLNAITTCCGYYTERCLVCNKIFCVPVGLMGRGNFESKICSMLCLEKYYSDETSETYDVEERSTWNTTFYRSSDS